MVSGLTEALIASREIRTPGGGTFAVRGLSPEDVFRLYRKHAGEMGLWFDRLGSGESAISIESAPALAASLLDGSPILAAEIIAFASGECSEETVTIARRLPLSVQASALEAVADLTFTQEMPPKKILEIVIRMLRQVGAQTQSSPAQAE